MYSFVIFGSPTHGFLSVQYTQTTLVIKTSRYVIDLMLPRDITSYGMEPCDEAGNLHRRVSQGCYVSRSSSETRGSQIWQLRCKISCVVGIGSHVTRDESRANRPEVAPTVPSLQRGQFPHQATLLSHTCCVSLLRQRKVRWNGVRCRLQQWRNQGLTCACGTVGLSGNNEPDVMLGWSYILIIGSTSGNSKTSTMRTVRRVRLT